MRANCLITRFVTAGESRASPPATMRMAARSCSGGSSLSRKPLAPARSASYTYWSKSNVVRMRVRAAGLVLAGTVLAGYGIAMLLAASRATIRRDVG